MDKIQWEIYQLIQDLSVPSGKFRPAILDQSRSMSAQETCSLIKSKLQQILLDSGVTPPREKSNYQYDYEQKTAPLNDAIAKINQQKRDFREKFLL